MKSVSLAGAVNKMDEVFSHALSIDPNLMFVFVSPSVLRDGVSLAKIKKMMEGRTYIGCSTSGEISNQGVLQDSVAVLSLHFDTTDVKVAHISLPSVQQSFDSGVALANMLKEPKLKAVILFLPGTNVNGSAVVNGLVEILGIGITISGGLAGDEINFARTETICNGEVFLDHIVAVGIYGDHAVVSCGSEGGWRPFGPARRVTKAEGNVLYELDGKPALQLYKQYLGNKAKDLPSSGSSYPFAVLRDDRTTSGIIRSTLNVDHEKESLILAGDIEEGCRVCLMHADTSALTQGAAQAATEALRTHAGSEENGCALVVSCVGRRIVLGIDVEDEIDAVVDSFLPDTPIAGYYSYGEICSDRHTNRAELHNQTMTVTYITESVRK